MTPSPCRGDPICGTNMEAAGISIGDLRCPMSSIRWENNFDDTQAVWKSPVNGKGGSKPLANQGPGGVRKSHRSLQELNAIWAQVGLERHFHLCRNIPPLPFFSACIAFNFNLQLPRWYSVPSLTPSVRYHFSFGVHYVPFPSSPPSPALRRHSPLLHRPSVSSAGICRGSRPRSLRVHCG